MKENYGDLFDELGKDHVGHIVPKDLDFIVGYDLE